jgi:hypothetical protein
LFLSPIIKAVRAPVKIISLETGIASWVENFRIKIKIGISNPPPPMPPAFEIAEPRTIEKTPAISELVGGKNGL